MSILLNQTAINNTFTALLAYYNTWQSYVATYESAIAAYNSALSDFNENPYVNAAYYNSQKQTIITADAAVQSANATALANKANYSATIPEMIAVLSSPDDPSKGANCWFETQDNNTETTYWVGYNALSKEVIWTSTEPQNSFPNI